MPSCQRRFFNLSLKLQPSGWLGLAFALCASSIFVILAFGREFIMGTSPYWRTQVDDVTQYIAGFNMYFTAPWKFPLLAFDNLNYPDGTFVTFVDAIPLYSLALKAFLPVSLAPFNPFGFWVAFSFLLQGVGGWWITRALKVESWFFLAALLGVFLTYPALMARIGHISLMSHWILLFSIALYIRSYRQGSLTYWAWTILLVAAFYINVYLFTMAAGVLFAALFSLGRNIASRDIVHFLVPFIVLVVTAFLMLLPMPQAEVTREWGFGYYSMNLLAPLTGGKLFALQVAEVPGQYEGFNYLGLGVLIALLAAYIFGKDTLSDILQRHRALCLLLLFYTFYALSNHIYFGGQKILVLSYPAISDGLTSQFRASGRFFWPVGYSLAIFALIVMYQSLGKRAFALSALLVLGLQLADLEDRYKILRASVLRDARQPMDFTAWDDKLGKNVQTLYFYPKFKCGGQPHESLLPVMRYASERDLKLNTGYIARHTPDCGDISREISKSDLEHSAYIFERTSFPSLMYIIDLFPDDVRLFCTELQFAHLCQTRQEEGEK